MVFDASVLVDALVVAGPAGDAARAALQGRSILQVPTIFAAEVTSALRSLLLRAEISPGRARAAVLQVRTLRTLQYPFEPFSARVWALRDNLTVYDAWYVALAESLKTSVVTADDRLAGASGPRCPVIDVATFSSSQ